MPVKGSAVFSLPRSWGLPSGVHGLCNIASEKPGLQGASICLQDRWRWMRPNLDGKERNKHRDNEYLRCPWPGWQAVVGLCQRQLWIRTPGLGDNTSVGAPFLEISSPPQDARTTTFSPHRGKLLGFVVHSRELLSSKRVSTTGILPNPL